MGRAIQVGIGVGTRPSYRRIRNLARTARFLRAHSIWVVDHFDGWFQREIWTSDFSWVARNDSAPNAYYDYQVLAGVLARSAGRMQVAVGVTEAIRRHPVLLAQAFLTLSHITKRPPILGIGAGEKVNVVQYGLSFEQPVSRLEEALEVIKRCFDGGPVDFQGKFFQLDNATFELTAGRAGRPEIWVAAHGPRMLGLTGRYGDGWYPNVPMTPDAYKQALDQIMNAAYKAGRAVEKFTPSMQAFVVIAPNREQARRLLDAKPLRYFALISPAATWTAVGATHPFGDNFGGIVDFVASDFSKSQLLEAMAAVPVELLEQGLFWGTPTEVVLQLRALADAGLRHVVLVPLSAMASRRAAAFVARSFPGMVRRLQRGV